MIILGIDPGATSGWCRYDPDKRRVVAAGHFPEHAMRISEVLPIGDHNLAVIERPKGYGPTRPQLVDCGYVCGRIVGELMHWDVTVTEMTRKDVCKALSAAMHGEVNVRSDATAWAALLELHGGPDAAKKGGPLHGVKSHSRAALAVAFAYSLSLPTP